MILVVFFLLFFSFIILFTNNSAHHTNDFDLGNTISVSGILSIDNNYPIYTHSLEVEWASLYLKSSEINLNTLTGDKISIWWEIVDTHNNIPIIEVSAAHNLNQNYILKNRKYIFPHDFFILDVQQDANISIVQQSNKIQVFYNWVFAFGVNSFICNKIIPDQDCKTLREQLIGKYVKTFKSPLWYQFFQSSDDIWYILEKDSPVGYIFYAPSEDDLVNLSYVFFPIDSKLFTKMKQSFIERECLWDAEELVTVKKIYQENIVFDKYLKLSLWLEVLSDKKKKDIDCDLLIDLLDITIWSAQ